MKIIGLEGGVGAGKTTALQVLAATVEDVACVHEYMDFAQTLALDELGRLNPEQRCSYFLDIEFDRKARLPSAGTILLDRTFLTILAYEYSHLRMGLENAFSYAADRVISSLDEIIIPNSIIYLSIGDSTRRDRLNNREGAVLDILMSVEFNGFMDIFFAQYGRQFLLKRLLNDPPQEAHLIKLVNETRVTFNDQTEEFSTRLRLFFSELE